jgi:hypothetical protein
VPVLALTFGGLGIFMNMSLQRTQESYAKGTLSDSLHDCHDACGPRLFFVLPWPFQSHGHRHTCYNACNAPAEHSSSLHNLRLHFW